MFTGIIEETGIVEACGTSAGGTSSSGGASGHGGKSVAGGQGGRLHIACSKVLQGTKIGDSIAVNGVCLTVCELLPRGFIADVMAETFRRTNLGSLKKGSAVNLERAMASDGRFGGHIVSGHIDGTGQIEKFVRESNAVWVYIKTSAQIMALVVEKGSIAIDGISLTVAKVGEESFAVSVIPHTASETTLLKKKVGDLVNLENDIVGKYVKKLLGSGASGADVISSSGANGLGSARIGGTGSSSDLRGANESRDQKFLAWLSE